MKIGPVFKDQLNRLARGLPGDPDSRWKQGEHILISGSTGSGKTMLGRHINQIRIDAGSHVIMFVCKMQPDRTIIEDYKGWTRWKEFKRRGVSPHDNKILLWPDVGKGNTTRQKREIQREVFQEAVDLLLERGKWTVDFDEGLYMCDPKFMNMSDELAMLHAMGRSAGLTLITKMQRPSNVPLILYGSAAHAILGRTREAVDNKRLAELGSSSESKDLSARIKAQGRHDFLWVPVAPDWEPETINLRS